MADKVKSNMVPVSLGGVSLNLLIDSGATKQRLSRRRVKGRKLYTYTSDKPLTVKGAFTCAINTGAREANAGFVIIDGTRIPLLGEATAMELGVLKIGLHVATVSERDQTKHGGTVHKCIQWETQGPPNIATHRPRSHSTLQG